MNKMFVRVTLCVLALSLVSLAADRTTVTTKPVKGGHATKVETPRPDTVYLLNNFDDNTTGTYYCCSGNIIVGPNNTDGESPYNEAIQFTVSSASHITGSQPRLTIFWRGRAQHLNSTSKLTPAAYPAALRLILTPIL